MRTATIRVCRDDAAVLQDAGAAFVKAWREGASTSDVFTFASPAQLFTVLSPRRWALVEALQGLGATSLRGLARALGRDVKRVHEDVALLRDWGFIERTETTKICVPYGVIHADFDLRATA